MKNAFLLTILFICTAFYSIAQKSDHQRNSSGLALAIGASASYYYGEGSRNFDKFENERLNWQLNGMLGITLARSKEGRRTMLAAYGVYGFNNKNTMAQILKDQNYITAALNQSTTNNYYQYEGGVLIDEILRLSTGLGQQNLMEQSLVSPDGLKLNTTSLRYYSSTVGLNINLGPIAWLINCNFAYGKDYKNTVITPSSGLVLRF